MTRLSTCTKRLAATSLFALMAFFLIMPGVASAADDSPKQQWEDPGAPEKAMQQWRDFKFGMFIHWGPVSLKGTEIGWSRGGDPRGRGGGGNIPPKVYDNLYKEFNPTEFDPDEWVGLAEDAGMRYMVFTTKHHDGFCNFDSDYTDYKITAPEAAYGKDIVKMLSSACHKNPDVRWGIYYSQPDWHHPDFLHPERHADYVEYLHHQVRELLTNYGRVHMIFFDGLGHSAETWNGRELVRTCRELQAEVVINNRCGIPADYDTPENRIGFFQKDRPWETCATIADQWAWKPDARVRSYEECMRMLVTVAIGNGNLLLNVGPKPNGRIAKRQTNRLRRMGDWLDEYGESIYGTRGGPFLAPDEHKRSKSRSWTGFQLAGGDWWGGSTHKDDVVYLHILRWPNETVSLPAIEHKIRKAVLLTGGAVKVHQSEEGIEVSVPESDRNELDTIVKLELDGPAGDIPVLRAGSDSLTLGKKATASNVFEDNSTYSAAKAVDGDYGTRWATDAGTEKAWLEVDLGEPKNFDRVEISEWFSGEPRVQKFELQVARGDEWETILTGDRIGQEFEASFDPVEARRVRLNILEATDGPTIHEFELLAPKD